MAVVLMAVALLFGTANAQNFSHQKVSLLDFSAFDTTTTDTFFVDTSYYYIGDGQFKTADYYKMTIWFESDVTWGGMSGCTALVALQKGITGGVDLDGSTPDLWSTLATYTISGDSTFGTTGYDLWQTYSDSLWEILRFRVITTTDIDDTTIHASFHDSTYSSNYAIHVRGTQAVK